MRFCSAFPPPTYPHRSPQRKSAQRLVKPAAWGRCRGPNGRDGRSPGGRMGVERARRRERRGGRGDDGNDTCDAGGDGGVNGRGIGCEARTQISVSKCVRVLRACTSRYAHVCTGGRAHLGACRRCCRSGRSSEPTGEGGTKPWAQQGRALESARPLGSAVASRWRCRWKSRGLRACKRS